MNKKVLILALAFVLVAAMSVGITLAYLTDTTAEVKNTFTIGKVEITLDEAKVDEYGVVDTTATARVIENEYKLIPGHEYTKDPTVHVDTDSEDCWVFVKVTNGIAAIEADTTIAKQMEDNGWTELTGVTGVYYKEWASGNATDLKVFESFKVKADVDISSYDGETITVIGYAVQKDGISTPADAWAAVSASGN